MMVGEKEHVMKQTCAPHAFGLPLITVYDTRRPSKIVDKSTTPLGQKMVWAELLSLPAALLQRLLYPRTQPPSSASSQQA